MNNTLRLALPLLLLIGWWSCWIPTVVQAAPAFDDEDHLSEEQRQLVERFQRQRIQAIEGVIGSVIAVYDDDRQGGGSGVIIDPSGIALTNHHVIMGAGVSGWGGLADGKLYRWKLIGTDPGGDVSIIQMEGRDDFPFTPLGDSDTVRAGDWALAMGNPFILTEDQKPTVTLGIVSGVKRYQPGAGLNQLVYGNCIQVDSSINPGNSGGPLFNLNQRVIGINGRGSFKERGRVNVGLGYAISSNQIKNFIPDLLATKLVEHATLDANFEDRGGKVVCSRRNLEAPISKAGLELGDELLTFENIPIKTANQFTNLICTLPESWPVSMTIRKPDGRELAIHTRALGLPYQKPKRPQVKPGEKTPEQEQQIKRQMEMVDLLSADPGKIRFRAVNRHYCDQLLERWRGFISPAANENVPPPDLGIVQLTSDLKRGGLTAGQQTLRIATDGQFELDWKLDDSSRRVVFDGRRFFEAVADGEPTAMTLIEAKLDPVVMQAFGVSVAIAGNVQQRLGNALIDGSGKSNQQPAWRLRWTDDEGDDFFWWLQMENQSKLPEPQLTKLAADINGDRSAVMLLDWEPVAVGESQLTLPTSRKIVKGLAETVVIEIQHRQADKVERFESPQLQTDDVNSSGEAG